MEKTMNIRYVSDGELSLTTTLEKLIANLNQNGGWKYRHNAIDMRDELNSRGWYEGAHEFGHYLVLNLNKLGLEVRDPAMND
jgi:hypothetical protein